MRQTLSSVRYNLVDVEQHGGSICGYWGKGDGRKGKDFFLPPLAVILRRTRRPHEIL